MQKSKQRLMAQTASAYPQYSSLQAGFNVIGEKGIHHLSKARWLLLATINLSIISTHEDNCKIHNRGIYWMTKMKLKPTKSNELILRI